MGIAAILAIIFFSHTYFPFRKSIKKGREMPGRRYSPLKPKHQ
jgi:hypothetical protein